MKKSLCRTLVSSILAASLLTACAGTTQPGPAGSQAAPAGSSPPAQPAAGGEVTLDFTQWWEPEMPPGALRGMMDQFEQQNPGIKVRLISGPYANTKEQVVAGAATGTMSDVCGLDGSWINDFVGQGALASLSDLMQQANFDGGSLATQIQMDAITYMIPVVNYVYMLFVNNTLFQELGIEAPPANRSAFFEDAKKLTDASANRYGWILPLSLEMPNGIQNDVMSWVWSSGGRMLKDGKPDLTNPEIKEVVQFVKDCFDAGVMTPGAYTQREQDKVEEFTNGRVGMMVSSIGHIIPIREANPDLDFSLAPIPFKDGYTGTRGLPYVHWGIGVAENSAHKAEAWKLIEFLLSEDVNAEISSIANAFPCNKKSVPDYIASDVLFSTAFEVYQQSEPVNEFTGLPVAEELMRIFDEQLQLMLEGEQTVDEMLAKVQAAWEEKF